MMARLLLLVVDNFEDTEMIGTLDVIRRGGDEVTPISMMNRHEIKPKYLSKIYIDKLYSDVDYKEYDGLVIPGGPGSFQIMPIIKEIEEMIHYFVGANKLVAAICAAPHLVGKLGYFNGRNFTVHPGFENYCVGGNYLREKGVVRDGNFITAKSMWYSQLFGLEIHAFFHGKESRDRLELSLQGEK